MAWYKIKTNDGAEHRLWFGHDPSEDDVIAAISAPKISPGQTQTPKDEAEALAQEKASTAAVLERNPEPNPPAIMGKAALALATGPGSPLMTAAGGLAAPVLGAAGRGILGTAARAATSPPAIGAASAAGTAALEGASPKHIAMAGLAGAAVPYGIGRVASRAATQAVAQAPKAEPALIQAANQIEKTLIETGWEPGKAAQVAKNAIARMASEAAPMAATTPAQFNPESLQIIAKLRQLAQTSGANKIEITQAAQQAFPESWKEVMKMIMAPRTRI